MTVISYQELLPKFPPNLAKRTLEASTVFNQYQKWDQDLIEIAQDVTNLYYSPCLMANLCSGVLVICDYDLFTFQENSCSPENIIAFNYALYCVNFYQEKYKQGVVPIFYGHPFTLGILGIMDKSLPLLKSIIIN